MKRRVYVGVVKMLRIGCWRLAAIASTHGVLLLELRLLLLLLIGRRGRHDRRLNGHARLIAGRGRRHCAAVDKACHAHCTAHEWRGLLLLQLLLLLLLHVAAWCHYGRVLVTIAASHLHWRAHRLLVH